MLERLGSHRHKPQWGGIYFRSRALFAHLLCEQALKPFLLAENLRHRRRGEGLHNAPKCWRIAPLKGETAGLFQNVNSAIVVFHESNN